MKTRFGSLWHFYCENYRVARALDILLKGYSQVMFQSNPLTGLLFFIGIFWSGCVSGVPQIALGGLIGTLIATLCAYCFAQDKSGLKQGLYGYNGCLVGIALPTFLVVSPALWVWIVFGSALSTFFIFMMRRLGIKQTAILTAPFVFSSWLSIALSHFLGHCPYLFTSIPPEDHNLLLYCSEAVFQGISEVFLCHDRVGGALMLLGLATASVESGLIAFLLACLAILIASWQGDNSPEIAEGLYAFSAVLTALALGEIFYPAGWRHYLYPFIGVILTVLCQRLFNQWLGSVGLPALTFPFVCVCWIFLLILPKRKVFSGEN